MPARSTIVGATSGVVLLAAVVGFAVGLPKVTDDESSTDSTAQVDTTPVAELLPKSLLNGQLVRYPAVNREYAKPASQVESYGGDKLTQAFDTDVAVAIYTTRDVQVQVALTVYDGESGLFLQKGPPVPPEMAASSDTVSDVVREGDSVCIAQWQTQAYKQDQPPFQVQCQRVVDGRTINVYAAPGLTVKQAVDIVDDVVDQDHLG